MFLYGCVSAWICHNVVLEGISDIDITIAKRQKKGGGGHLDRIIVLTTINVYKIFEKVTLVHIFKILSFM